MKKYKVTSGRVMFSKTIQERQFEPKHAEVELSFELDDESNLQEALAELKSFVKQEALDLVGIEQERSRRR